MRICVIEKKHYGTSIQILPRTDSLFVDHSCLRVGMPQFLAVVKGPSAVVCLMSVRTKATGYTMRFCL